MHDPVTADLIAEEGLVAVALGLNELLVFSDEGVEELADAHVLLLIGGEHKGLYLACRDGLALTEEVVVVSSGYRLHLIEEAVDALFLSASAEGAVVVVVPAVGTDALSGGEVNHLLIDGEPCHNRHCAVCLAFSFLKDVGD